MENKCIYEYDYIENGQAPYNDGDDKSKSIYIFLTKTNTLLSNIIHYITRSEYTHAGISFDLKMKNLYSFSRIYRNNPFIGGFMREDIENGVYACGKSIPCAIYELKVSEEVYKKIDIRIKQMMLEQKKYRYNVKGLIYNYFNIEKQRPYYYFCSEFVAEMLLNSGAIDHPIIPSFTKPKDLKEIPEMKLVFSGDIKNLKSISL
ncbi:hypothetical protein SAMN02745248_00268 [Hathewaya proteolytica DSM 3090]|uniref:Permuted papain-like amidase enzyme, YaeF/YiiX, C92 family n=1 Tax=Hathewaya proteolytica DSM 3090 TaxID=1121331 RepID=A0A1M6JPI6_9CLOT|nr:hypothetical protein [Hathewaya proteolytica]SHJ48523.1 hypothetical protein SAMN02745248_00268 [Hathewaya proteolytica DSM 3090]